VPELFLIQKDKANRSAMSNSFVGVEQGVEADLAFGGVSV
jgi:hypothetical protein